MDETITIIGSGNVATQLGLALKKNGFNLKHVISLNLVNAKKLAKKLNCKAFNSIENSNLTDIYLIAVNDDAIEIVAKQIQQLAKKNPTQKPLLLHTSGSVSVNVLSNSNVETGIIYPLQTIKKNRNIDFGKVPFIYFSNNATTLNRLKFLATKLSNNTFVLDDEQRVALHIAAVFTNNFTNHIIAQAQVICKQNKINFSLLQPLLAQTFENLKLNEAAILQTGPAIRGDNDTIKKHLKLLQSTEASNIYKVITNSIIKFHKSELNR